MGSGGRGQRVADIVSAFDQQGDRQGLGADVELKSGRHGLRRGPDVELTRRLRMTESDRAPVAGQLCPDGGAGIIARINRHAIGGQVREGSTVFVSGRLHAIEKRLMLALSVGHHRNLRLRDFAQPVDFAGMIHAQFKHCHPVLGAQPEYRLRQTDVVVQIAARGQRRRLANGFTHDGGQHFLDRSLAIAAQHRQHRQIETRPPAARHDTQRPARIGNPNARLARMRGGAERRRLIKQIAASTSAQGRIDERMTVEMLATQGHIQAPGLQLTAVGTDRTHQFVTAGKHHRLVEPAEGFAQFKHLRLRGRLRGRARHRSPPPRPETGCGHR